LRTKRTLKAIAAHANYDAVESADFVAQASVFLAQFLDLDPERLRRAKKAVRSALPSEMSSLGVFGR
jgi:hypothetical protein